MGDVIVISRDDILRWIKASALVISENRDYMIQLDSAYGDGDHGANMDRGFQALIARLPEISNYDIGTIFKNVGITFSSTIGGASGPLYSTFFLQASKQTAGKLELNLDDWFSVLKAALDGIILRGNAEPGDKTMVDALFPAVNALKQAAKENLPLRQALIQSAQAAKIGMKESTLLIAHKVHGSEKKSCSVGHQDPGATSMFLILKAATDTWTDC